MKRIYAEKINIDCNSIKEFYKERAINKVKVDIDSPVVLCGDKNKDNIKEWTDFEVENRLKFLKLDNKCNILEVGCGTGRISKYLIKDCNKYLGIDYVKELVDIAKNREDILKNENIEFINVSLEEFLNEKDTIIKKQKFNRFVISGGVFTYINDTEVKVYFEKLKELLDTECIVYISEPIANEERLTLNKFYSDNLESEYSAIYRTVDEYEDLFKVFYEAGFKSEVSEEFFYNDIKAQKETKQWLFVLSK